MSAKDTKRIEAALDVLYEEGIKSFKDECKNDIPRFQAIGMAFAAITENAKGVMQLTYAFLEDWNYHDLCAVIEWVYPLFGQTFHRSDLARLERMVNKQGVTILAEWNNAAGDYRKKRVNVRLLIEEEADTE